MNKWSRSVGDMFVVLSTWLYLVVVALKIEVVYHHVVCQERRKVLSIAVTVAIISIVCVQTNKATL